MNNTLFVPITKVSSAWNLFEAGTLRASI